MEGHWNAIIGLVLLVLYFLLSSVGKKRETDKVQPPVRQRPSPRRALQEQSGVSFINAGCATEISSPLEEVPPVKKRESRARRLLDKNSLKETILKQEILAPPLSHRE